MIIWNKNIEIDKSLIQLVSNFIRQNKFSSEESNPYSSYFDSEGLVEVTNFYGPIIDTLMKDLSLYHRSRYDWNYWVQMYTNKLNGHGVHDHLDFTNILSWVHFIQVPKNQKCFYFLDSNNNKLYPEKQSFGDFIVFPSWSLHGVDKLIQENFNRIIIAGNVSLNSVESNLRILNFKDRNID